MRYRTILHIDMDAFYASVEQLDYPDLKGKPVIVGGGKRGVVSAASYEARAYGVHSAMPIFKARKLCPTAVFQTVRMDRYVEVSHNVMAILHSYAPLVEQVSIDEAFLDISGTERLKGPPLDVAVGIKDSIKKQIGITSSIGMAPNKFLAKIASDLDKPDGLYVIQPNEIKRFLAVLPISKIPGVGNKTVTKLKALGVESVGDVLKIPENLITNKFGKYGHRLLSLAAGVDESSVTPYHQVKSVSTERTFSEDTTDREAVRKWVLKQSEEVGRRLRRKSLKGRTVTLKIKTSDFVVKTRRKTLRRPTDITAEIFEAAAGLLDGYAMAKPVRLIGVGVSSLDQPLAQLSIWDEGQSDKKKHANMDRAVDTVKDMFGGESIKRGSLLDLKNK